MSKNKSKCHFNTDLRAKYPFLTDTQPKKESVVFCTKCKSTFSIASGGQCDIARHLKSKKHLDAVKCITSSKSITNFVVPENLEISAMEGAWAFHVVKENHSFRSADCASQLFKRCFGIDKFSCSRTKCTAIITHVFAPLSVDAVKNELNMVNHISVYTDASNHGAIKLFPVVVRYFVPFVGVRVRLLNVVSEAGETSDTIVNVVLNAVKSYGLENKIVAYCADNARVNFGGENRGGVNNVFYKLKSEFPHLLGLGCTAHIVHNALKFACDSLPFDIECIVVKIYSHFYIYAVRTALLQEFCENIDIEYLKLLGYAKTRFLAMAPAIKRILDVFDGLTLYFENFYGKERLLKDFFRNPIAKFWLIFALDQVLQANLFFLLQLTNVRVFLLFLRRNSFRASNLSLNLIT